MWRKKELNVVQLLRFELLNKGITQLADLVAGRLPQGQIKHLQEGELASCLAGGAMAYVGNALYHSIVGPWTLHQGFCRGSR